MSEAPEVCHLGEDGDAIVGRLPRLDRMPLAELRPEEGSALAFALHRYLDQVLGAVSEETSTFNNFV